MHSGEDRPHEEARVRIKIWNVEENSRSVFTLSLSLSPHEMLFLFVQLTRSTQLSYFLPFSSMTT